MYIPRTHVSRLLQWTMGEGKVGLLDMDGAFDSDGAFFWDDVCKCHMALKGILRTDLVVHFDRT